MVVTALSLYLCWRMVQPFLGVIAWEAAAATLFWLAWRQAGSRHTPCAVPGTQSVPATCSPHVDESLRDSSSRPGEPRPRDGHRSVKDAPLLYPAFFVALMLWASFVLADELLDWLDRPFAFFGNSGGNLIAFELAHLLGRRFGLRPEGLFVGSLWAPHALAERMASAAAGGTDLASRLESIVPPAPGAAGADPPLDSDAASADARLFASYRYEDRPPLDCPIAAFVGRDDALVTRARDELRAALRGAMERG